MKWPQLDLAKVEEELQEVKPPKRVLPEAVICIIKTMISARLKLIS